MGVLDLSNPIAPVPVDVSEIITQAEHFYAAKSLSPWAIISDSLVYVNKGRHGLQIVNLSSGLPSIVGHYYAVLPPFVIFWGRL